MLVTDIVWDIDELDKTSNLPAEMEVPDELFDGGFDDDVADYLSDQTGYCVKSFIIED